MIVTGGSSGIGLAVARLFAARSAAVTLIARRASALEQAADTLAALPGEVGTVAADVRDDAAVAAAIRDAEAARGSTTDLVTSAGSVRPGRFLELSPDECRRQMDVNLHGTVAAVRAVYPGMVARGTGRICMIASAAGLLGIAGYTAYAPSKFAVRGFAEALRMEARGAGVRVSVCYPPDTDTPQLAEETPLKPPETKAITGAAKVWRAEDVARLIVRGMDRGHARILPGLEVAALARFGPLLQPLLDWQFDRVVARARRQ